MSLPNNRWEEIEPGVYVSRGYTQEQIERQNRRPTEMIKAALKAAPVSRS